MKPLHWLRLFALYVRWITEIFGFGASHNRLQSLEVNFRCAANKQMGFRRIFFADLDRVVTQKASRILASHVLHPREDCTTQFMEAPQDFNLWAEADIWVFDMKSRAKLKLCSNLCQLPWTWLRWLVSSSVFCSSGRTDRLPSAAISSLISVDIFHSTCGC
jgi:hypothetical protein